MRLVVVAPLVPHLAAKLGSRQTIGVGFALTAAGFVLVGFVDPSWRYAAFLLPLVAIAVGMGLSNGPASSAATSAVSENQVGEASGVSNMARYVGAAVATALAATIYSTRIDHRTAAGASPGDALASGLAAAAWMMAIFSVLGVLMAVVGRAPPRGGGHGGGLRGGSGRPPAHAADLGHGWTRRPRGPLSRSVIPCG